MGQNYADSVSKNEQGYGNGLGQEVSGIDVVQLNDEAILDRQLLTAAPDLEAICDTNTLDTLDGSKTGVLRADGFGRYRSGRRFSL
ncbi:hypothetical protein JY651_37895 [Pyxidicoccus parkwayensis]|uniref:Uncharacterized protein n=1 Tax=Pyxidicoccus parkwayensis TaxID=2813578 RepID=A0ABX7NQ24_9BACT|nr:hypothetical protein [Pyxidicoccus parkwaysis]QSQ20952.1 hypothetical protein JY651_37895 [Pyxidicoccus parkwaysis]